MMQIEDQFATASLAAQVLGAKHVTVSQLCQQGKLPAIKVANRWLIPRDVLELTGMKLERTAALGYHYHYFFYSPYVSSAQRLPNGNTLICEGDFQRVFKVTTDHETVWEYVLPP